MAGTIVSGARARTLAKASGAQNADTSPTSRRDDARVPQVPQFADEHLAHRSQFFGDRRLRAAERERGPAAGVEPAEQVPRQPLVDGSGARAIQPFEHVPEARGEPAEQRERQARVALDGGLERFA